MRNKLLPIVALSAACLTGPAHAQGSDGADARQPQPAEIMPLADQAILNDLAPTGEGFVAVGERGHILRSGDGKNWQQSPSPVRAMLTRAQFLDADHGWAVGHDGSVLRTDDGGKNWTLAHFDSAWGKPFYDLLFSDADTGVVSGANGRMLKTDDGGESWTEVSNPVFDTGFHLYDINRLADGTLAIAGERGMLARSTDDGETWEMLVPPYIGSYFGVLPYGEHGAVFFGLQGRVFAAEDVRALPTLDDPISYDPFTAENVTDPAKLADMGWRQIGNPEAESLFGGAIYDGDKLVLVGVDGSIVHGRVADSALKAFEGPTDEPLADVVALKNGLLLVGRTGIYHSSRP